MKSLLGLLALTALLTGLHPAWAGAAPKAPAAAGRGIDVLAYCRKTYGDSAGISQVRSQGDSWRCTLGKRAFPVDMVAACKLQYDDSYTARLANPADSYTWSCVKRVAPARQPSAPAKPGRGPESKP